MLNKNYGVILNVSNSTITNDGEYLTIKIPKEEILKFGKQIVPGENAKYFLSNNSYESISGVLTSVVEIKDKGFTIYLNE